MVEKGVPDVIGVAVEGVTDVIGVAVFTSYLQFVVGWPGRSTQAPKVG